jgi:hypothetical protein
VIQTNRNFHPVSSTSTTRAPNNDNISSNASNKSNDSDEGLDKEQGTDVKIWKGLETRMRPEPQVRFFFLYVFSFTNTY